MTMDAFPEDWEVVKLRCIIAEASYGVGAEAIPYNHVVKYIRITDINDETHGFTPSPLVSPAFYEEKHRVEKNDILIARTGASVGKSYLYNEKDGRLVYAGFLMRVRVVDSSNASYVFLQTLTNRYAEWVKAESTRTGQPGLNLEQLKSFAIPLPPLAEQRRIAAALGDMDKLIDNLSKRIEKKKSIKQGAMQELLTGKKRLPGFEGEWEMVRIGNIGDFYGGLSGKTAADFGHGEAQYITFMNVLTNIVIKRHQVGKVSVYQGEHQNAVKKGDLFFNVSSETPEEVAMCAALLEDMPNTYLNSFCCGFRLFDDSNDPLFISYYVNSHEGRKMTKFLAQGLTRHNLSKDAFRKMEMNWPKKSEQRAIAKVLGDMDAEIAKLEAKHEKLIGIKKGMMSDLLTGKVRLKTEMERRK